MGLLILARQPRPCVGLRAHEEGRADVRARARKDASRWEGSPLLAWPRASALDAYDRGETPDVPALLEQMREVAAKPTQTEVNTANIDYLLMAGG